MVMAPRTPMTTTCSRLVVAAQVRLTIQHELSSGSADIFAVRTVQPGHLHISGPSRLLPQSKTCMGSQRCLTCQQRAVKRLPESSRMSSRQVGAQCAGILMHTIAGLAAQQQNWLQPADIIGDWDAGAFAC